MSVLDYQIKLSDRENAILNDLYEYRVMTTEQIKKIHFDNKGYYVNKVLMNMRKRKLIKSSILKNSRKGKKGFSYHRLTETGLEYLSRYDMSVEGQSSLYARPKQVAYLLMVSDLVAELTNTDWEIWDSRKVKKEYNLDKRMNIQGMAITPDKKKYGLYILAENSSVQTIGKIQSEIEANAILLHDYLIIGKGKNSFVEFTNKAVEPLTTNENAKPTSLNTGYAIKVYPYTPFITKAKAFRTENEWIKKLCNYYGYKIKSMDFIENRQSFPIIIEHNGKEWYFVDLTDSDLKKYRDIEVYAKSFSSQSWEKRDIIAVSLSVPTQVNFNLEELPAVENEILSFKDYMKLCTSSH